MATYLELVQQLHIEVGAAGVAPTTIVGARGQNARLVGWVKRADLMVQSLWHNWKFLHAEYAATTVASTRDLAAPADVNIWDFETFRLDGDPLEAVEYQKTRHVDLDDNETIPAQVIIMPDRSLRFDPVPDATYSVTADYFVKPTLLAADSDVSVIPEQFHETVVLGRAIALYGNFENAAEIKDQGLELYSEFLPRLESLQLPNEESARYTGSGAFFDVVAE